MDGEIELASRADMRPGGLLVDIRDVPFEVDAGIGSRACLGLIVLETDQTIEHEFRAMLPRAGVALYAARLHNDVQITPAKLLEMEALIEPTSRLLPSVVELASIGFGCTSGALTIGEPRVHDLVRAAHPDAKATDPVSAAVAAFKTLGASRIGLLTPYTREINLNLRQALGQRGLQVTAMASFNEPDDSVVARISPRSLLRSIVELGRSPACDAVFVSCTSLRVAEIAEQAEAEIDKPVTSSNHAMAWHMLRLAGIQDSVPGFGRLFRTKMG